MVERRKAGLGLVKHTPRGHHQQEEGHLHCHGTLIATHVLGQAGTPD